MVEIIDLKESVDTRRISMPDPKKLGRMSEEVQQEFLMQSYNSQLSLSSSMTNTSLMDSGFNDINFDVES